MHKKDKEDQNSIIEHLRPDQETKKVGSVNVEFLLLYKKIYCRLVLF